MPLVWLGASSAAMASLLKHQDNTDVALRVIKKFYIKEKDAYSLQVEWFRVSTARNKVLWPMGITQRIKIPRLRWQTEWEAFPRKGAEVEESEQDT